MAALLWCSATVGDPRPCLADDQAPPPETPRSIAVDCGAYATGIVLRLLGREVPDFDTLRSISNVDAEGRCSLADVVRGLAAQGVEVEAIPVGDLPADAVCVVASSPWGRGSVRHFCIARRGGHDTAIVYNPPRDVRIVEWARQAMDCAPVMLACRNPSRARTIWGVSGFAAAGGLLAGALVLLGRRRARALAGPGALAALACVVCACGNVDEGAGRISILPSAFVDLGEVAPGVVDAVFDLRNGSSRTVTIQDVSSSCACAGVHVAGDMAVPEGTTRRIHVKVNVKGGSSSVVTSSIGLDCGPPVLLTVTVRGAQWEGIEFARRVELKDAQPRRESASRITWTAPATTAEQVLRLGKPSWTVASASGAIRVVGEGTDSLPDGRVRCWADVGITPDLPGVGAAIAYLFVGTENWKCDVDWSARNSAKIEPAILVLASESRDGGLALRGCAWIEGDLALQLACDDPQVAVTQETADGRTRLTVSVPPTWAGTKGIAYVRVGQGDRSGVLTVTALPR